MKADTPLFSPTASVNVVPVGPERICVVIDNVLSDPDAMVEWAAGQAFARPHYPYPGVVFDAPVPLAQQVSDCFAQYARGRLGGRRTEALGLRFSLMTVPPQELAPVQWQCHRDRLAVNPEQTLYAASVLYLFRNPSLGGTSFYLPKVSPGEIERMVEDSKRLGAAEFGARYGLRAGYMQGSNEYFDRVAGIDAAWNRMIFYDGGQFHSADINTAAALDANPRTGRLTLNGFFTCRRNAA
jgi:Family of unknown function (DUF6445)